MTAPRQPSAVIHTVGSKVWIKTKDGDSWVKGEVIKLDGDQLIVSLDGSNEQRKVGQEDAPLQNNDTRGVEVRRCAMGPGIGLAAALRCAEAAALGCPC
jgi:hypothetical protein